MGRSVQNKTAPLIITDGLIIRAYNGVGEADRFVTVLTRERGILRAAARGARRIRSRAGSATGLLCYSRLYLRHTRDMYIIDDAQPIDVFFGLREDMEKTALAQYFCELAAALCPTEEPAEEPLRLLLNTLHYLEEGSRPPSLLKAAAEWRLLCMAGYAPNLSGCARCGATADEMRFLPTEGQLYCPACMAQLSGGALCLPAETLQALRLLSGCTLAQCFSLSLPPKPLAVFSDAAERFLKAQLGRSFKTLDFYHQLFSD